MELVCMTFFLLAKLSNRKVLLLVRDQVHWDGVQDQIKNSSRSFQPPVGYHTHSLPPRAVQFPSSSPIFLPLKEAGDMLPLLIHLRT